MPLQLFTSHLLTSVLLPIAIASIAYFKKALSFSGAIASVIIGFALLWLGGWEWVWPMLAFFISGTILTKINQRMAKKSDDKHDRPRDAYQALANGGIGLTCCVLYAITNSSNCYFAYIFSMAVSMADTWSSEIGMMVGGKVVDIFSRKPVPAGVSGGVSNEGFAGGFAGAMIIGWLGFASKHFSITLFGLTLLAGVLGTVLDSILGSRLQIKYSLEKNNELSDFIPPNEKGIYFSGQKWMTNDMVNFLSNLIVTLFCYWMIFW
jgi:uncharacterized protein (TIGR00297 family)